MKTKRLTILALLTTMSLTMFVIESAIPTLIPIPGVKLGLANIVTLFVIKRYKAIDAAEVLLMRIALATMFAGQAVSFLYSLSGGVLCLFVMVVVNKLLCGRYLYITSILGAMAHNMGQLLVAIFILKLSGIILYFPFLMISGVITGLFTGLTCHFTCERLPI